MSLEGEVNLRLLNRTRQALVAYVRSNPGCQAADVRWACLLLLLLLLLVFVLVFVLLSSSLLLSLSSSSESLVGEKPETFQPPR